MTDTTAFFCMSDHAVLWVFTYSRIYFNKYLKNFNKNYFNIFSLKQLLLKLIMKQLRMLYLGSFRAK